eukprot:scaffold86865_cov67-Attheya_sp.AAC.2
MEIEKNEGKVDADSNYDEEMDNDEELEKHEDGVEEYEQEKEEIIEDPKERNTETIKEMVKDRDKQKRIIMNYLRCKGLITLTIGERRLLTKI